MSMSMSDLLLFGSHGSSYGAASNPSGTVPMPRAGQTALRAVGTVPVFGDGNHVDRFPSSPITTDTTIRRTGSCGFLRCLFRPWRDWRVWEKNR